MYRSEVFHVHGVTESLKRMKERGRENGVDRCTCHVEGMITNKRPMAKNHGQPPCHEKEKRRSKNKKLQVYGTRWNARRSALHGATQQDPESPWTMVQYALGIWTSNGKTCKGGEQVGWMKEIWICHQEDKVSTTGEEYK